MTLGAVRAVCTVPAPWCGGRRGRPVQARRATACPPTCAGCLRRPRAYARLRGRGHPGGQPRHAAGQNYSFSRNFTHAPAPAGSPSARLAWLASIRKTVPRAWIFRGNARKRIVLRIAGTGTTHRAGRATRRRARGSRSEPRRYATPFRRGPGSIHKEFSPQPSPANVFRASPVARYQQHAHGGTAIGRLRAHSIRRRRAQLPERTGGAIQITPLRRGVGEGRGGNAPGRSSMSPTEAPIGA